MKTRLLKIRLISLSVMIVILLLSNKCVSQTIEVNWWNEIIKEHKINKRDYRVIEQIIIFSDSISDVKDLIYFDYPVYISKGDENYHIYSIDSVIFSKNDSIINLYNGLSVGFARFDHVNKPISISEFNKLIYKMKENLMISTQTDHSFSWIDHEYFSKRNYKVVSKKKE
jgi:hypothetical protein